MNHPSYITPARRSAPAKKMRPLKLVAIAFIILALAAAAVGLL